MHVHRMLIGVVVLCSLFHVGLSAASEEARRPGKLPAEMTLGADRIDWQPDGDYEQVVLTVAVVRNGSFAPVQGGSKEGGDRQAGALSALATVLGVTFEHCGAIKEDEGSQDTAMARISKRTQNHSRAISFALENAHAHLYGRRNRWRYDQ